MNVCGAKRVIMQWQAVAQGEDRRRNESAAFVTGTITSLTPPAISPPAAAATEVA